MHFQKRQIPFAGAAPAIEAANREAPISGSAFIEVDEDEDAEDDEDDDEPDGEIVSPFGKPDLLTCISEENLFEDNLEENDEQEELLGGGGGGGRRGMLLSVGGAGGGASYSEPDLSRICDKCDECDDGADDETLCKAADADWSLTRQRTWHHFAKNGGGGGGGGRGGWKPRGAAEALATAAAAGGRLPVIAEVTSFV